jgi:glycine/D-amino acid oxidase-like deaminating enzyme
MFQDLEHFLRAEFGVDSIDYYWTNEDYESMDGMPFVGRASSSAKHLYVATGFNAWGSPTARRPGRSSAT